MFAQGTFKIGWEGVTFVNVAADLAHPATFAVFGLFLWLRLRLYVVLVIVVCQGRLVRQHLGIKDISDKHRMRAKIDALSDSAGQIGVGVLRDIKHMVNGTMLGLAIGKFVHFASRLKAEVLKDKHWCLSGQHTDVEHAGILNEVVGIVALVDRHGNL